MTSQEIVALANQARDQLGALDMSLNNRINEIARTPGEMTADQIAERNHLKAVRTDVGDAWDELGAVVEAQLNEADDVRQLLIDINAMNTTLEGELKQLKDIEAFTEQVASVLAAVATVATQLAKFA